MRLPKFHVPKPSMAEIIANNKWAAPLKIKIWTIRFFHDTRGIK